MEFLTTVTIGFLFLEATNVIVLYLFPSSKYANAVGIFKAWEKSKDDPEIYNFVKYLVNWVAGTKLIFIALLVVILIVADDHTLIVAGAALVVSIASFFWRLRPLICQMDKEGQIEPENYSQTLTWMIGAFILVFVSGIIISLSS